MGDAADTRQPEGLERLLALGLSETLRMSELEGRIAGDLGQELGGDRCRIGRGDRRGFTRGIGHVVLVRPGKSGQRAKEIGSHDWTPVIE
jgi:hypothetical protein